MNTSSLRKQTSYNNKRVVLSSQICHGCGALHPEMKDLGVRTMRCDCGLAMSRDQSAAISIKKEGLRTLKIAI